MLFPFLLWWGGKRCGRWCISRDRHYSSLRIDMNVCCAFSDAWFIWGEYLKNKQDLISYFIRLPLHVTPNLKFFGWSRTSSLHRRLRQVPSKSCNCLSTTYLTSPQPQWLFKATFIHQLALRRQNPVQATQPTGVPMAQSTSWESNANATWRIQELMDGRYSVPLNVSGWTVKSAMKL